MTEEQIFQLIKDCLPENLCYYQDGGLSNRCKIEGTLDDVFKFIKSIRKKTMEDILASLKNVPNPDANRSAINRIEWMMNYD